MSEYVLARLDFTPENDNELSLVAGERIEVLEKDNNGWWKGRKAGGQTGVFPSNFTDPDDTPSSNIRNWNNRNGNFNVNAEFVKVEQDKVFLKKQNGVTVGVPLERLSYEDLIHLVKLGSSRSRNSTSTSASRVGGSSPIKSSSLVDNARAPSGNNIVSPPAHVLSRNIADWSEFFTKIGCTAEDVRRYSSTFDAQAMDLSMLPEIDKDTLRRLTLKEGDIIRFTKKVQEQSRERALIASENKSFQHR